MLVPDILYTLFCTFKATVMLTLSIILLSINKQEGGGWTLFNRATRFTAFACFVLFVSTCRSVFVPLSLNTLTQIVWIPVSAMQAILFTYNCISFVNPNHHKAARFVRCVLYTLFTFVALLLLKQFANPKLTTFMIYVALGAYFALISYFTVLFYTMYNEASAFLDDAYDDDLKDRQRSILYLFYSALGIGIFSGITVIVHHSLLYSLFNILVPFYYLYIAICFINYRTQYAYIVKANYEVRERPVIPSSQRDRLADDALSTENVNHSSDKCENNAESMMVESDEKSSVALEVPESSTSHQLSNDLLIKHWIDNKNYLQADSTVDEIVKQIGVTRSEFIRYFSDTYSTLFRSWRIEMRIREAERIIRENPDIAVEELRKHCGYNDRSNFHKHFMKVTGMTINQYKESLLQM